MCGTWVARRVRNPFPVSGHVCRQLGKKLRHSASVRLTCMPTLYPKESRRLHLLRELKRAGLSAKDLLTCYYSFVRSTTECACQVWSTSLTSEQSHAVETIRRRAMQIISPHKTYDEALRDHRLVTLQQRRNELCNRLFKDIQNSSHRLNSLLPLQHNPGYQLRHSKKYPLPIVKTNRFKSSFINWCLYNCQ